jgi:hypothetical protein
VDIIEEWKRLAGENAGVIMAWTTEFMRQYWRLTEDERTASQRTAVLDVYRQRCFSGTYDNLIYESHELIREETGLDLPYLLVDPLNRHSDDE